MTDNSEPNRLILEWSYPVDHPAGIRLDRHIIPRLPHYSRKMLKELFAGGRILLNQRPARKGEKITPGDRIKVVLPAPLSAVPLPDPSVKFSMIYQDQDLLVIDKPGGIPSHPLKVWEKGTLANALVGTYPELRGIGTNPLEPGLVHRLDRGTSGILVIGKNRLSWERLKQDLAGRRWNKKYLALVKGIMPQGQLIDLPLAHHPGDSRRMVVLKTLEPPHPEKGYPAQTRVVVRKHYQELTLVEAELITGVTHQLRVHLAGLGHPVVGDSLYGKEESPPYFGLTPGRIFLHAARLELPHPITRERLLFQSDLSDDLARILDLLA
jgi:23S rRNA pseudouridine1911/1915/1917 synthase